jgi:flagellar FliL protein
MKKMMIIIIAAVLVIVLAGGGLTYFLIMHNIAAAATAATETTTEVAPVTLYTYDLTDYFVTNVKDSNSLFKVSIALVLNEDPTGTELKAAMASNLYQIRDCINVLLRSKTKQDLMADNVEDTLRKEIADTLNESLGVDYFVSAYFTDFVIQ